MCCCVAVCCRVVQFVTVCCSVSQCVAVCCSVSRCVAVFWVSFACCNTLRHLQHTATHRNTPQHTATHCNTLNYLQQVRKRSASLPRTIRVTAKGWRRLIGSLIFIGHFPQKWPIFSGSFVENDLQLRGSNKSLPPCTQNGCVRKHLRIYLTRCNTLQHTATGTRTVCSSFTNWKG